MQKTEISRENIEEYIPNLVVIYTAIRFSKNKNMAMHAMLQVTFSHQIHNLNTYRSRIWFTCHIYFGCHFISSNFKFYFKYFSFQFIIL